MTVLLRKWERERTHCWVGADACGGRSLYKCVEVSAPRSGKDREFVAAFSTQTR